MQFPRTSPWLGLLFVAVSAALSSGCGTGSEAKQTSADDPKGDSKNREVIVPVEVVQPKRGSISAYFETTARVEAERKVDIAAEGSGLCISLNVEEGDVVEAGQILAELKTDEAEALLRQARVSVDKAKTAFDLAQKQTTAGHGTVVDRDNTHFNYEEALAELEMRTIAVNNMTIRAPIGGTITRRDIQVGYFVTSGMPAFEIVDPDSYMLVINPPEKELPRLKEGQAAVVRIDALPGKQFAAHVRRINPNVDPSSGTVKVVLDFEPPDRRSMPESAFARVSLVMDTRQNVLLLPKDAIMQEDGESFVYVLRDAPAEVGGPDEGALYAAERVAIGTALEDSANVQVFRGLEETDQVVISGQYSLKPGSPVRIMDIDADLAAKAGVSADEALAAADSHEEESGESGGSAQGGGRDHF